ncbi:S8 family serine peptidase [cf. Phormidesmis sp. LEGE 11477]|uniref:S8 family serine peptidase n=1 Tax=cf. Phormidesmis sp. LEGE 11477 TaxID=1828680 RepID=UPI00187E5A75|nr:S8 family serine peptidase [cf. Phormidesmis sp. LEGE 11477]MBE9059704.1 S8 family serine peptidase [cf. Phormidesmis sp. LEGE 11477]
MLFEPSSSESMFLATKGTFPLAESTSPDLILESLQNQSSLALNRPEPIDLAGALASSETSSKANREMTFGEMAFGEIAFGETTFEQSTAHTGVVYDASGIGTLDPLTGLSQSVATTMLLNSQGDAIAKSTQPEYKSESLDRVLIEEDSFVKEFSNTQKANTDYRLMLSEAAAGSSKPDRAGNTPGRARDLGVLNQSTRVKDFVGRNDRNDFYRFSLSQESKFSLSLTGLGENANVRLLSSDRKTIEKSANKRTDAESIERTLAAGDYLIKVFSHKQSDTAYKLQLSATAALSSPNPNVRPGDTLDTAGDLGSFSGSRSFENSLGSTNQNDYYRFTLEKDSDFSLILGVLSGPVDAQLLDSSGSAIANSAWVSGRDESIRVALTAGTYYVNVSPYFSFIGADYTLDLSATERSNQAGNTFATAFNMGRLSKQRSFQSFVGPYNKNDYYRFNVNKVSQLEVSLGDLGALASVELYDSSGTSLRSSQHEGILPEGMLKSLHPGTYYVRVYVNPYYSRDTDYTLSLSTTPLSIADGAGNTREKARDLGVLNRSRSVSDLLGAGDDKEDYYRFELKKRQGFSLSVTELNDNINVKLLDSSGRVIESSSRYNDSPESIDALLDAGVYYIRLTPRSSLLGPDNPLSTYQLSLAAEDVPEGFDSTYGYGLINAADAIATALGRTTPLKDVRDLGGNNWGVDMVNAPEAWAKGYTGKGIVVAVVDSGVDYNHSELRQNIWRNKDEIANNGIDDDRNGYIDDIRGWSFVNDSNDPMDENSHGTHVAGTIASAKNNIGVTGVAYDAQIMPIQVLNAAGSGFYVDVAAGIRYAVDNGADVVNLSLGSSSSAPDVLAAMRYASERDVIVVSASGNEGGLFGATQPMFPARYAIDYGIAIGALDSDRTAASFSNPAGYDANMRYVTAPGVDVLSTTPDENYSRYSGTSMAAPHSAGVVALLLQAKPNLTHAQVRKILMDSATKLP